MKYLKEWRQSIEKFLRTQIEFYNKQQKIENVLEIGVGTSTNIIRQYFPKMIIIDNYIDKSWKNVRQVDLCKDPPEDMLGFFDLIICAEVLEHTKQPWLAAESLTKILKINGILLVTVPALFEHHPGAPNTFGDYWRFMPGHSKYLFPNLQILKEDTATFGGVLTGITYSLKKN